MDLCESPKGGREGRSFNETFKCKREREEEIYRNGYRGGVRSALLTLLSHNRDRRNHTHQPSLPYPLTALISLSLSLRFTTSCFFYPLLPPPQFRSAIRCHSSVTHSSAPLLRCSAPFLPSFPSFFLLPSFLRQTAIVFTAGNTRLRRRRSRIL